MEEKIIIGIAGYAIGSIPFAYLLSRMFAGIDLRSEGSGNIGARNALEVTGKKWIGVVTLILDLLKGLLPIALLVCTHDHDDIPLASFAIVLGHCYPVWLKFRGGRGLATAAGILLLLSPTTVLIWLVFYWLSAKLTRNVHIASALAVLLLWLLIALVPAIVTAASLPWFEVGYGEVVLSLGLMAIVILTRHIEPIIRKLKGLPDV